MKFYVHRTHTIMSGLVIRWNPANNLNAEVSASRDAVCISGLWDLKSPTDIAAFRMTLAQAEEARHRLACHRTPTRYENELELPFGADFADVVLAAARADEAAAVKAGQHPKSWLDCSDCRARSKSGAEPPRCEAWVATGRP